MDWRIRTQEYSKESIPDIGNRLLTGNGYMGIRGTLDEQGKEHLACVNLAGIYDQVGDGWREPLNAPNPCWIGLMIEGKPLDITKISPMSHEASLDYRHGIFERETRINMSDAVLTIRSERFASRHDVHGIGIRYEVCSDAMCEIEVITGIDGDVWDIHGPHYDHIEAFYEGNMLGVAARTHELNKMVVVGQVTTIEQGTLIQKTREYDETTRRHYERLIIGIQEDQPCVLTKVATIYTSDDVREPKEAVMSDLSQVTTESYGRMKTEHMKAWEALWVHSAVIIEGDDEAIEAVNYSLYHLEAIAPRHSDSLSIAARGLSGQTYKGAVFWDTEMFMLEYFMNSNPSVAKTLLQYRVDTLAGAKEKAASYGYEGAFYPWESQEGGYDACSDYNVTDVFTGRPMRTYFKDKQVHISAAIVYGLMTYYERTSDISLMESGGYETIIECGKFYYDLLLQKVSESETTYYIHDVIGPDEYHERVNNNGYTNRMACFVFETAVTMIDLLLARESLVEGYSKSELIGYRDAFLQAAKRIFIPKPDERGIIPQFDGYFDLEDTRPDRVKERLLHEKEYWGGAYGVASETQVIKQADVIAWLSIFPKDVSQEVLEANWRYYEPRTEHGSSLSACMYAIAACRIGEPEIAYPFFMKSAKADLKSGGKQWAGLVYIGGTHPAAAGGAYMTLIKGFAGLITDGNELKVKPQLPKHWTSLRFHIHWKNRYYGIDIHGDEVRITPL